MSDLQHEHLPSQTGPAMLDEQLARRMAHDVNNYLQAIVGFASTMSADSEDEIDADRNEIIQLAMHAAEICRFLVDYRRPQASAGGDTAVDAHVVLRAMRRVIVAIAGSAVVIEWDVEEEPAIVATTPNSIEQIVLNLVLNAHAAMPDGGVLTVATRRLRKNSELSPTDQLELVVSDTGVGMDAGTRERIFEPFFTTKGANGTGLGLATVLELVTSQGGSIDVQTAPDRGTRVRVRLPLHDPLSPRGSVEPTPLTTSSTRRRAPSSPAPEC